LDARSSLLRIIDSACFVLGLTSAAVSGNIAPLICAMTPPLLVRLLWNERTPPVFLACLLMQWIYASCNVFYSSFSGYFPGVSTGFPNLDLTMTVIMAGLVCQALGFALIYRVASSRPVSQTGQRFPYDLNRLRWITVISALVAFALPSITVGGAAATFHGAVLQFHLVILALTVFGTLVTRTNPEERWLTGLMIAFCTVLCFSSRQSTFKEVVLISLVSAACAIRIRPTTGFQQINNRRVVVAIATSFVVLFFVGIVWESQIKPIWRTQELPQGKVERISEFIQLAAAKAPVTDPFAGTDALLARMNNMWQMSLVLERVPLRVPHADGSLTLMAVKHVTMPRILFPGKASLVYTNRLLAEKYLGIRVGENASVGVGYLTVFYVDFGIPGVFLAAFILGMFLGCAAWSISRFAPSPEIGLAITIATLWGCFSNAEANLAKGLGAFLSYGAIYLVMGWLSSRFFQGRRTSFAAPAPIRLGRGPSSIRPGCNGGRTTATQFND
jgi:hypothetical protein